MTKQQIRAHLQAQRAAVQQQIDDLTEEAFDGPGGYSSLRMERALLDKQIRLVQAEIDAEAQQT